MSEYAMQDQQGISSTLNNAPTQVTPRHEQVKWLDEQLSKLQLQVDQLSARLGPALRPSEPMALVGDVNKKPEVSESDIVAHLRHTTGRVAGICDQVYDLCARIDI